MSTQPAKKTATLYRMVMPKHICPFGLKSKDILERHGFEIDDRWLTTREQTDQFMAKHHVKTTPQTFIDGKRIGGFDELAVYFHEKKPKALRSDTSYQPVIAIFSMALFMAVALTWYNWQTLFVLQTFEWFIALAMCLLALQKLQDIEQFSTMFLNYDVLAQKWVRYSKLYPFGEAFAGVCMIAGVFMVVAVPVALFIGTVGAISVVKAVYIEKRELKCACVGGNSKVPLGFVSLTENLMMIGMAVWMAFK
ncbi:MauE/DoxX family redox-associated membrane protein [Paenalcaligenes hominis]|uniref:MauE/DoxX family redox-associated membrane protein n=1 Tax=Paenalcaligenes hominis TaxID=643674 RepID=UPI003524FB38